MKTANIIDAIRLRLFWMKYGIRYLRSSNFRINTVKLGDKTVHLSLPAGEEETMREEFKYIFYDDCYGLGKIEGKVDTILDVGGNIGFFSLAARSRFPNARIHTYEPNPGVHKYIDNNTGGLDITVHHEAVGAKDGMIDMKSDGSSLLATAVSSANGSVKKTAIATAVERLGGSIDLLKLDCEGGEWELLADKSVWPPIKRLTMEYHLWANPTMEVPELIHTIRSYGFRITHLSEAPELKWGVLHATSV